MKTPILPAAAVAALLATPALALPVLDANADGKVSRDEFRVARTSLIMAADVNKDGKVTLTELDAVAETREDPAAERTPNIAQVFRKLDLNKNEALTREEVEATVDRRFDMLDTDHDGFLVDAERKLWRDPAGQ